MSEKIVFSEIFKGKTLNCDLRTGLTRELILTPCNPITNSPCISVKAQLVMMEQ